MSEEETRFFVRDKEGGFMSTMEDLSIMPKDRLAGLMKELARFEKGPDAQKMKNALMEARQTLEMIGSSFYEEKGGYWDRDERDKNPVLRVSGKVAKTWDHSKNKEIPIDGKSGLGALSGVMMIVWASPKGFKHSTPSWWWEGDGAWDAPRLQSSWEAASVLWERREKISAAFKTLGFPPFDASVFRRGKDLSARMKEWVFEDASPEAGVLKNEAYAIWDGADEDEGFVQKPFSGSGSRGPLSTAIFYDTEKQAQKSAEGRKMRHAFVVTCAVNVQKAAPVGKAKRLGALKVGLARAEEKALDEALSKASAEKLRARLAELEGAPSEETPGMKRRL